MLQGVDRLMKCENCGASCNVYTAIGDRLAYFCCEDCKLELQYMSDRKEYDDGPEVVTP